MAASSITKDFYVKDYAAFERLKKDLESTQPQKKVVKASSLEKGRELLSVFMFCSKK